MFLVDGKVLGLAVELAGAGVDDHGGGVDLAADFEQGEVGSRIEVEVLQRVAHTIDVADLTGEVEDKVLADDDRAHPNGVADVRHRDIRRLRDSGQVEAVAAVPFHERIDQVHLRAQLDEPTCEVASQKTETARDQATLTLEGTLNAMHASLLSQAQRAQDPATERADHQPPPELEKLLERRRDLREFEELRGSGDAGIVMNAHFGERHLRVLHLPDQFAADGAGTGGQLEAGQDVAANQAEVAGRCRAGAGRKGAVRCDGRPSRRRVGACRRRGRACSR